MEKHERRGNVNYDRERKILRKENLYTVAAELFMCKLEAHYEELNWLAYDVGKFVNYTDFKENADENIIIDTLAQEAAEIAASYFDYSFVVPLDLMQKCWALWMVFSGTSLVHMERFGLDPME